MKRKTNSGFTLTEVLVAMSIFSIAILGLAIGATSVIRANQTNLNTTIATNLAQDKLEALKGTTASTITACSSNCDNPAPSANGVTFARTWTVNLGGTGSCPSVADYKCITVTVSWTDYQSRQVTISSAVKT